MNKKYLEVEFEVYVKKYSKRIIEYDSERHSELDVINFLTENPSLEINSFRSKELKFTKYSQRPKPTCRLNRLVRLCRKMSH